MSDTSPPAEPETMVAESAVDEILDAASDMTPIYVVADLPDGRLLLSRVNEYPEDDALVWISDANEETAFEFVKIYDDFEPGDVLIYAEPELWENSPVNPNNDDVDPVDPADASEVVQAGLSDPVADLRKATERAALDTFERYVSQQEATVADQLVRTAAVPDVPLEPAAAPSTSSSDEDGEYGDESADPDPAGQPELSPELVELEGVDADLVAGDADGDGVFEPVDDLLAEFDDEPIDDLDDDQVELLDLVGDHPQIAGYTEKLFGEDLDEQEPPSALDIIEDAALGDPSAEASVIAGFEQAYTPDVTFDEFVAAVFPPRPEEPMAVALAWDTAYESAQMWFPLKKAMGRPDALRREDDGDDVSLSDYETVDADDPDMKPALTASLGAPVVAAQSESAKRKQKLEADNARYRMRQRKRGRGDLSPEEYQQRVDAARASAEARRKNRQDAKGGGGKGKGSGKGKKPTKKQLKNAETGRALVAFQKHGLTEDMITREDNKRVTGKSIFAQARMFGALRESGWSMTVSPDGSGSAVSPEGQKLKFGAPPRMSNNPWDPGGGRWDSEGNYINYDEFAKAVDRASGGTVPGHIPERRQIDARNAERRRKRK